MDLAIDQKVWLSNIRVVILLLKRTMMLVCGRTSA